MLVAAGAKVSVADNLERGRKENLQSVWDRIEFHQLDLTSLDNCLMVTRGVNTVFNLTAKACGVEYSQQHHGEMMTFNTLLGFNLLEAARQNGVERFLVVSTSCVYPEDAPVPTREDAFTGVPEKVNEGYALGKIAMELQARYYAKEYGMKIAIARPNNAYGARDVWDGEKSHVIPALIKRVLDGEDPLVAWGSGRQSRAFVHASDIARAFMLLVEKYPTADPVNVGHENETTIADLVRTICALAGRSPRLVFDTTKPEGAPRKGLSSEKLKEVTGGFVPEVSIEKGLREMVDWYMTHYRQATEASPPALTIVTPVYCEDELIKATISEVKEKVAVPYEMLIVYDFDEDPTLPHVRSMMSGVPELKLVKNTLGRGVINAIRAGIQAARGRYIVIVNGDLSDQMSTINEMYRQAQQGFDLICGTRYSGGGQKIGGPFTQDLLSRLANKSFRLLTRCPTGDVTNSFKMYRTDFLQSTAIESSGGFEFSFELLLKAIAKGLKVCELPTVWKQRKSGESKFRLWSWLQNYLRWYWRGLRWAWFKKGF
jgi:nucleoside-diphosphate-sugar epimerase